jgi:Integrase core domain
VLPSLRAMGIRDKHIAPGSPWQNCFAERLIGTIRRECVTMSSHWASNICVKPHKHIAPERAACSGSNLKLDPYFHDLRARNLEVCTGPLWPRDRVRAGKNIGRIS